MKNSDCKIVVIGMGYLATYIIPCYEKLLGDKIKTNLIGIKRSEKGLKEKQAECNFPVIAGRVKETLEERRPDIIVLAVKPDQIVDMVVGTLKPYYQMLREKGEKLPDLYSFAPDPSVDYYYDTLGNDVNAANMIPNMIKRIGDYEVAEIGVSFVSFDPRRTWPEENRKAALEFLIPTGTVVEIDGDKAVSFLSLQVACHLMFEFNYIVQEVLKELGKNLTMAVSASTYRAVFRKIFDEPCADVIPCTKEGIDKDLLEFMEILMEAWYRGILRFSETEKIPHDTAHRMICGSMETYQMQPQLEPKEALIQKTKNHATPGGFLEMCMRTFYKRGYAYIAEQLKNWMVGKKDENVRKEVEAIAFEVVKAISDHGRTLRGAGKIKLKTLIENTSCGELWEKEHGLSLYLETERHKLLFDTGKTSLFLTNAARMELDISRIDTVIISHGHYDHGGGLPAFLERNKTAKVYISEKAFEPHFSKRDNGEIKYIGIDGTLTENAQLHFVNGTFDIDEELTIFSGVKGREFFSKANDVLLERRDGQYEKDSFQHEQNLIVRKKDGSRILISGCAHNGIVNIIERFIELEGQAPDVVIGGFHLMEPSNGKAIPEEQIFAVAERLLSYAGKKDKTRYFTCHCTGLEAYEILKEKMGDRISYLSSGSELSL